MDNTNRCNARYVYSLCCIATLDVIRRIGQPNIGLVIDFWHLFATGKTTPANVAALDPALIFGVHFCDGRTPRPGEAWE